MTPFKMPKVEAPKVGGLDPQVLEKINGCLENVADLISGECTIGEIVEDEVKGIIHEKVMEVLEPHLTNDIVKNLADKAVEKAIDKTWDKTKEKIAKKFANEE